MKPQLIWLIEDCVMQGETFRAFLQKQCVGARIEWFQTEKDFWDRVALIKIGECVSPDLVVCDVMMPWGNAGDFNSNEVPEIVLSQSYRRAGTRCWKVFREVERHRSVPWVYFTILPAEAIEFIKHSDDRTLHVRKDDGLLNLWAAIENAIAREWR